MVLELFIAGYFALTQPTLKCVTHLPKRDYAVMIDDFASPEVPESMPFPECPDLERRMDYAILPKGLDFNFEMANEVVGNNEWDSVYNHGSKKAIKKHSKLIPQRRAKGPYFGKYN